MKIAQIKKNPQITSTTILDFYNLIIKAVKTWSNVSVSLQIGMGG